VGISAPPAGRLPMGKPIAVPRSHGFQERAHSCPVIQTLPLTGMIWSVSWRMREATQKVSPTAKSPTATVTTSIPSSNCGIPKVNRLCPERVSIPTNPSARPMNRLRNPRATKSPSSAVMVVKASTTSAKYSAGPKRNPICTMNGARNVRPMVPTVPATKEPMAAVASAAAPRPRLAILFPSMAVTMEADSPGVLSRIDVVDPPYMPP
jgi:hypothetical protein